jgi:ABC-2 type transport system permease protein
MSSLRPYLAAFRARFVLMLQYRAAAIAGFGTQLWFGVVMILVLAAFYRASDGGEPISLRQGVTYIWLGQAFLALLPWISDPDVSAAMRTGNIAYDRLRPVDTYFYWFSRVAGWMTSRAVPRASLMFVFAAIVLPLCGLEKWSLRPPASTQALGLFVVSIALVVPLAAAVTNLLNVGIVATMSDRGVNALAGGFIILLAGNVLPLPLAPDAWKLVLLLQPFAGLSDIPARLYVGALTGEMAALALGAQVFWIVTLILIGRILLNISMARLQAQGG